MNRYEFLYRLQQGLAPLRNEDRTERCAFYEELISDMLEDGYTEEEATARLGDPAELAAAILQEETSAPSGGDRPASHSWREALMGLLQAGIGPIQRNIRHTCPFSLTIEADDVRSLEIRWPVGDVEVVPEDRFDIMLTEEKTEEAPPLYFAITDGVLRIDPAEPEQVCREGKDLKVGLPEALARVLDNCRVVTGSGDVALTGLRAEGIQVKTKSGDVSFRSLRAVAAEVVTSSGDLDLEMDADIWNVRTASGDLKLRGGANERMDVHTVSGDGNIHASAQKLELQTVSGDLCFSGEARHIRVGTVSGDAELTLAVLPESFSGSTTSGDLDISLPEGSQCRTSFRTKSGDLSCRGRALNTGTGPLLEVSTISGDVTITA